MTRFRTSSGDAHRQAQALLPWYVTGQLEPDEAQRIKAHLDACPVCRVELAAERRLREAIVSAPVEAREGRAPPPRGRVAVGAWAAAAIAASVAMAAVASLWAPRLPAPHAVYRTLSDPIAPPTGGLVVVFDPTCPEGQMSSALARAHARIVDGPTAQGAYVLRVPPGAREAALAALRRSPGVRLAQSLGGPG
jgi:anti-sigma factor RsiW